MEGSDTTDHRSASMRSRSWARLVACWAEILSNWKAARRHPNRSTGRAALKPLRQERDQLVSRIASDIGTQQTREDWKLVVVHSVDQSFGNADTSLLHALLIGRPAADVNAGTMSQLRSVMTLILLALLAGPAAAQDDPVEAVAQEPERSALSAGSRERDEEKVGFLLGVAVYLPNRVLDLFDIFRARIRIGPGIALGVRATEWADAYAGVYMSGYVGLPGPRNRKMLKMPFGIESKTGVEVSKADLSTSLFLFDPDYGETEFGLDVQLLLVGGAVGFDPGELVDFLAGFVVVDPKRDDIAYRGKDDKK